MRQYLEADKSIECPEFPLLEDVQVYLESYCKHFSLHDHIRFGATVRTTALTEDKKWRLTVQTNNGQQHDEVFDRLVVATGPKLANWPQNLKFDKFKGQVLHSQSLKE